MSKASADIVAKLEAARKELLEELDELEARRAQIRRALGSAFHGTGQFHGRNKQVMDYIQKNPDCTAASIASALSIGTFDIQVCLYRLRKRGLIDKTGTATNGYAQLRAVALPGDDMKAAAR